MHAVIFQKVYFACIVQPQIMRGRNGLQARLDIAHQRNIFGDARDCLLVVHEIGEAGGQPLDEVGGGEVFGFVHKMFKYRFGYGVRVLHSFGGLQSVLRGLTQALRCYIARPDSGFRSLLRSKVGDMLTC
jgi:hypothetical protein